VAAELCALSWGALPFIDRAEAFVSDAGWKAPLALLATPTQEGAVGRPKLPVTGTLARRALECILDEGCYDAIGLHSCHSLLVALTKLVAEGVLVAGSAKTRVFTLAPKFEAARQALRDATVRD
jgi:hypothetical protein